MGKGKKIYTHTGDQGETSLIGGQRVPKSHEKIEAYGTLDELNAFTGLVIDLCNDMPTKEFLMLIQQKLFAVESLFAAASSEFQKDLLGVYENDIEMLEREIDRMNEVLPQLNSFILPAGHPSISSAHVARTVCRRAERCMVRAFSGSEQELAALKFINRLSDFFFVLARKFDLDMNRNEVPWTANK